MGEKTTINTLQMVRRIRDDLTAELAGKSAAEVVAFYRAAGEAADAAARRSERPPRGTRGTRRARACR